MTWSQASRAAARERMKALHTDPEFKAKVSAASRERMKALHADPEFKAKVSAAARERMKARNADPEFNPRLAADLALYLGDERLRRKIAAIGGFAVAPSFRGEDGRPVYLDEIGYTDETAAATLLHAALGALERALAERRKFFKMVYDLDAGALDDLVAEKLGPWPAPPAGEEGAP